MGPPKPTIAPAINVSGVWSLPTITTNIAKKNAMIWGTGIYLPDYKFY